MKKQTLYLIIATILLPLVWSCDNDDDELKTAQADAIYTQICAEKDTTALISLWKEYIDINAPYADTQKARLTLCNLMEGKGYYKDALEVLARYEEFDGVSKFTNFRRAQILSYLGQRDKAKAILEDIVSDHPEYESVGFFRGLFNRWINGDRQEEIQNYEDYLYGYYCNLKAILVLNVLDHDPNGFHRLDDLFSISGQLDDVVEEYLEYTAENRLEPYHKRMMVSRCKNRLNLMSDSKSFVDLKSIIEDDIVQKIYTLKWNLITAGLVEYDKAHGYEATAEYFRRNMAENNGCLNFYDRFVLDTYLSYGNPKKSVSKTTYEDFKTFLRSGFAYIIVMTPNTSEGESALINHGILSSRVLLGCNEWNIADSTLINFKANSEIVQQDKTLTLLDEDYCVDTIRMKPGRMGARISVVPVPVSLYQLLVADFGNKESCVIRKAIEYQNATKPQNRHE